MVVLDVDNLKEAHRLLDREFSSHLKIVREHLRQPSVSAEDWGVREMAETVLRLLRKFRARSKLMETEGYPVVYGELKVGDTQRTLLQYGMYDVQPVGDEAA